jgi:hypothetical protein
MNMTRIHDADLQEITDAIDDFDEGLDFISAALVIAESEGHSPRVTVISVALVKFSEVKDALAAFPAGTALAA